MVSMLASTENRDSTMVNEGTKEERNDRRLYVMKRIIIGPSMEKDGKPVVCVNPELLYLDTSVWIEMLQVYRAKKDRIIQRIAAAIGTDFRLLVSTVNFFELIGTSGDISGLFAPEFFGALDYVRQTSVLQPPFIPEQEVRRFVGHTHNEVRILDPENFAIENIKQGFEERRKGNTQWFQDKRCWWDECNLRDRVLNLDADLYELTKVITYGSAEEMLKARNEVLHGPLDEVKVRREQLAHKKMKHKGTKQIPPEDQEVLENIRHRIDKHLRENHGAEKVSMVASKLRIVFPGYARIARDIARSSQLSISVARKDMPAIYWQAKIDYYNRYFGRQGAGGQLGDRNHAVYIPYCSYFGTCDGRLVKALESECKTAFTEGGLRLFRTSENT